MATKDEKEMKIDSDLFDAARDGNIARVKKAIENENIHVDAKWGSSTMLHAASFEGHEGLVIYLLSMGATVNIQDILWRRTALHYACMNGHTGIAQLLTSSGTNIDITDQWGRTALHWACKNGHTGIVQLLISSGANIDTTDKIGKKPLDYCHNKDIVQLLKYGPVFKRGLHEGYVYITNLKLVLLGPPCVGKTAFKNLLFNWPAPKKHHSTAISTRPIRAVERVSDQKEGKIWLQITEVELFKMLSDAIQDLAAPEGAATISSKQKSSEASANFSAPTREPKDISTKAPTKIPSSLDVSTTLLPYSSPDVVEEDVPQPKPQLDSSYYSKDILDLLAKHKKSEELHRSTWIHVLDSGGQPQFADISRFFLHGNAIHVILTKLTESLYDKPQFCYSLNGKLLNQPSELQMTNLELIENFVHSIVSSKNIMASKGTTVVTSKPLFVIVGTYLDQLKKTRVIEILRERNAQLLSALQEFRGHFIFHDNEAKELIFPVDNLCWWSRKKISSAIRQQIMSKVGVGFNFPVPVRWYMLELKVSEQASQEKHGIISFDYCCEIGGQLGMDVSEVEECVTFFDSLSLFLYYPKVLPNIIFTNPQYLLDSLSTLVRFSFVDLLKEILPDEHLSTESQRLLREDGIFEDSVLDKLSLPFIPPLFSKDNFLELLCYLCIIAPLPTADHVRRYFMPIVLTPSVVTDEDKAVYMTSCDPMIIEFSSKVVPQGIFPAMVVSLLGRKDKPQFSVDSGSRTFERQHRYGVKLHSEDLFGNILLVDNFKSIEVYFTGLPEKCPFVREAIKEAITTCTELLSYDTKDLKILATLACKQKHRKDDGKLHGVRLRPDNNRLLANCLVESEIATFIITDPRQLCWLNDPILDSAPLNSSLVDAPLEHDQLETGPVITNNSDAILDKKPRRLDLQKLLAPIEYQWRVIGEALQIKHGAIKSLEYNSAYTDTLRLSEVLQLWMDQKPSFVSWRIIIEAIEKPPVNNSAIAEEMRQFLSKPNVISSYTD